MSNSMVSSNLERNRPPLLTFFSTVANVSSPFEGLRAHVHATDPEQLETLSLATEYQASEESSVA